MDSEPHFPPADEAPEEDLEDRSALARPTDDDQPPSSGSHGVDDDRGNLIPTPLALSEGPTSVSGAGSYGAGPVPPRGDTSRGSSAAAVALIALLAALVGGGLVVAVLAIGGDLGGSGRTSTVLEQSSVGAAPAATTRGGVSASALYADVAPGIIDITAQSQSPSTGSLFGGGGGAQTDLGSGFEIDNSGDILTAGHVVDGASSITVTLQNGTTRSAKLLGEDRAWDVAVIRISPDGLELRPLTLGSSRSLVVGDYLAAIGDPFGYQRSLSTGVVAGLDRTISAPNGFSIAYAIQTDAALNPGNSGGPILDASGQVVGIADQIATGGSQTTTGTATSSGVGFAVPIDLAKIDLPRLKEGQPAAHGYLGVSTTDAPNDGGVLLQVVEPGTPAASDGLRVGDILTSFNGAVLHGSADLIDDIAGQVPGNHVILGVKRGQSKVTVTVTLGTQPSEAPNAG